MDPSRKGSPVRVIDRAKTPVQIGAIVDCFRFNAVLVDVTTEGYAALVSILGNNGKAWVPEPDPNARQICQSTKRFVVSNVSSIVTARIDHVHRWYSWGGGGVTVTITPIVIDTARVVAQAAYPLGGTSVRLLQPLTWPGFTVSAHGPLRLYGAHLINMTAVPAFVALFDYFGRGTLPVQPNDPSLAFVWIQVPANSDRDVVMPADGVTINNELWASSSTSLGGIVGSATGLGLSDCVSASLFFADSSGESGVVDMSGNVTEVAGWNEGA